MEASLVPPFLSATERLQAPGSRMLTSVASALLTGSIQLRLFAAVAAIKILSGISVTGIRNMSVCSTSPAGRAIL